MLVCLCNVVSEKQIREKIAEGVSSLKGIQQSTQAGKSCGSCLYTIQEILSQTKEGGKSQRQSRDLHQACICCVK